MSIGVTTATSNAQRVKVGDFGSLITIELNKASILLEVRQFE